MWTTQVVTLSLLVCLCTHLAHSSASSRQVYYSELDAVNQEYEASFADVEDIGEKLYRYKRQFIDFDLDQSVDIDSMELKNMMERIGQAKTRMELRMMIREVDTIGSGTISYREFLDTQLGTKLSVLRLILQFEDAQRQE